MIDTPEERAVKPVDTVAGDRPFRCDVSFVDEHAIVAVTGELDLATSPELLREVQGTLALPLEAVSVDLTELSFMDSSGIQTLLLAKSSAAERGMEFSLSAVSAQGRYVLGVAGLTAHFGLDATT